MCCLLRYGEGSDLCFLLLPGWWERISKAEVRGIQRSAFPWERAHIPWLWRAGVTRVLSEISFSSGRGPWREQKTISSQVLFFPTSNHLVHAGHWAKSCVWIFYFIQGYFIQGWRPLYERVTLSPFSWRGWGQHSDLPKVTQPGRESRYVRPQSLCY